MNIQEGKASGSGRSTTAARGRASHFSQENEFWPEFRLGYRSDGSLRLEPFPEHDFKPPSLLINKAGKTEIAGGEIREEAIYIDVSDLTYDVARAALQIISTSARIYLPRYPLTLRETVDVRPSWCWRCHDRGFERYLDFNDWQFGCLSGCKYYACGCGYCLCDLPDNRRNWLGQSYPRAGSGSGFVPYERAMYVRAAHWLVTAIIETFDECPLLSDRNPDSHQNIAIWSDEETLNLESKRIQVINLSTGILSYDGTIIWSESSEGEVKRWPY